VDTPVVSRRRDAGAGGGRIWRDQGRGRRRGRAARYCDSLWLGRKTYWCCGLRPGRLRHV